VYLCTLPQNLRLILKVSQGSDGSLKATMDSPDQNANDLPVDSIVIQNGTHNSYECVEGLVADFIDKGTAQGLDTFCVEKIKRPPFTILK
jgi:hypothetical protein